MFQKLFKDKDKKTITNLAVIFAIGVILLLFSGTLWNKRDNAKEEDTAVIETGTGHFSESLAGSYEKELENRLADILSKAEGIGRTEVMLTLSYGREIVVAEDTQSEFSQTTEVDGAGGTRETNNSSIDSRKLYITDTSGKNQPLILKEIEPQIEGVIVISEGGDDIYIKDAIIKAAQTVLGVEPHKVQVLKMKQ